MYRKLIRVTKKHRAIVVTGAILLIFGLISLIAFIVIRGLIGGVIIGALSISSIAIFVALNPGLTSKGLAAIYKLLSEIYSGADKRFVASDIEGVINSYKSSDLGFKPGNSVKIRWVDEVDRQSFIENEEVIVRLAKGQSQPENIAVATLEYAKKGIVPDSRPYLNSYVNQGLNYSISERILENDSQDAAHRILWNDFIMPNISSPDGGINEDKPVTTAYYGIDDTRKSGLLGPVLLNEFNKLDAYGRPDSDIQNETVEFLNFLKRIATKDRNEDVPLQFDGDEISVQIVLAARATINDPDPYISRCKKGLAAMDTTYLLAIGQNIDIAEEAAMKVKNLPGVDEFEEKYHTLDEDSNFGGEIDAYYAKFESIKQNW